MASTGRPTPARSYTARLRVELQQISDDYVEVLSFSAILNIDPNREYGPGAGVFIGFASWGWSDSDDGLERLRMGLLASLRGWAVRFRLLFPDPTPTVQERLDDNIGLLERWLLRPDQDHSVPADVGTASGMVADAVDDLGRLFDLVRSDDHAVRVVVDTNALIDNPDLGRFTAQLGPAYMVHILPVVLSELDDLKRSGRTPELRDAARRADRRLKGLRDNGDVRTGARIAGEAFAVFDFREPQRDGLPTWLDLHVPDDRLVAACLRLQSDHPGSALFVATGDLNLQNKLAAVGLPFFEPS